MVKIHTGQGVWCLFVFGCSLFAGEWINGCTPILQWDSSLSSCFLCIFFLIQTLIQPLDQRHFLRSGDRICPRLQRGRERRSFISQFQSGFLAISLVLFDTVTFLLSQIIMFPWNDSPSDTTEEKITQIGVELARFMEKFDGDFVMRNFSKITERALVAITFPTPLPAGTASIWSSSAAPSPSIGQLSLAASPDVPLPDPAVQRRPSPSSSTSSSGMESGRRESESSEERCQWRRRGRAAGPAGKKFCVFCKNNAKDPKWYNGHQLYDKDNKVACPNLRRYNCPICNCGGGDYAHTIRHCPQYNSEVHGK